MGEYLMAAQSFRLRAFVLGVLEVRVCLTSTQEPQSLFLSDVLTRTPYSNTLPERLLLHSVTNLIGGIMAIRALGSEATIWAEGQQSNN